MRTLLNGLARPVLVSVESEAFGMGFRQDLDPAAIQAVVQVLLWEQRDTLRFLSVNPSRLKKYIGAKGKDEVLLQVYKRYGREFRDHNIADAYVLAMIGLDVLHYERRGDLWPEVTKPQQEVLDALLVEGFLWERLPESRGAKKRAVKAARAATMKS
mgnify:FL=1